MKSPANDRWIRVSRPDANPINAKQPADYAVERADNDYIDGM
ncbi:MAG TPA: hypothetical protein VEO54_02010 [Thermoanaerobaculia bacterium]|nr:hypothetical protein [Thermoanaerobaculia bacterium]